MEWYAWLGVGVVGWLAVWLAVAVTIASGVVTPGEFAARAVRRHPGNRRG